MSKKLSREEWKAQVLKVLENTPTRRPETLEQVEQLRTEMYKTLLEPIYQEVSLPLKTKVIALLKSKGLTESQRGLGFDSIKMQVDYTLRDSTLHNLLLDMIKNNEIVVTGSGSHKKFTSIDLKDQAIENAKRMKVL